MHERQMKTAFRKQNVRGRVLIPLFLLALVLPGCPNNPTPDSGTADLSAGTDGPPRPDASTRPDAASRDLSVIDLFQPDALSGPDPGMPGPRSTVSIDLTVPLMTTPAGSLATTVVGPSDDGKTLSTTGAPFPLVIISPGFTIARTEYQDYADRLASYGFVAVLQSPRSELNHAQYRDDTIALITWLLAPTGANAGTVMGRIDANRVGLTGHSLGGLVSILVTAQDSRVKALFGIDPVDGGTPSGLPLIGGIHLAGGLPFGTVGETTSEMGKTPCAPMGSNFQAFYNNASSPAFAITIVGAAHSDFVDDYATCAFCIACMPNGTAPRMQTHDLTVKYMTAYFLWGLEGNTGAKGYVLGAQLQQDVMAGLVTEQVK